MDRARGIDLLILDGKTPGQMQLELVSSDRLDLALLATYLTLMFLGASFEAWMRERWIHAALEGP